MECLYKVECANGFKWVMIQPTQRHEHNVKTTKVEAIVEGLMLELEV
jgi:hypothetical protein